jgi:hypothetical protein
MGWVPRPASCETLQATCIARPRWVAPPAVLFPVAAESCSRWILPVRKQCFTALKEARTDRTSRFLFSWSREGWILRPVRSGRARCSDRPWGTVYWGLGHSVYGRECLVLGAWACGRRCFGIPFTALSGQLEMREQGILFRRQTAAAGREGTNGQCFRLSVISAEDRNCL